MKNIFKHIDLLVCGCFSIIGTFVLTISCSWNGPEIRWIEGEENDGKCIHRIVIDNAASLPEKWTIWFSQMPAGLDVLEGSDADIRQVQGNLYKITPRDGLGFGDSLVISYRSAPLPRRSWAPEGFVLQDMNSESSTGTALNTVYEYLPLESDGEFWYGYNVSLEAGRPGVTDIIPSLKRVSGTPFKDDRELREDNNLHSSQYVQNHSLMTGVEKPDGWYRLSIDSDGKVSIIANDADGEFYARMTLSKLRRNSGAELLRNVYVEDWPDFQYRGYMLDVSRNFTTPGNLKRLIDILSGYKVNYLHLHLADDEGWRLEIDGIPELTSVGAFHCLNPELGLQPSYDGCADPHSSALSNGFYNKDEFKDILRYAWERRIRVIPEFDTPGHSRAAIYSMKAYEKRTGDESMRLQNPADSSRYCGAQGYTDNVMSVELESVYKFIGRVFDSVIRLYADAGTPLEAIHIGGDEVPSGAWYGRPLHATFLGRVADIAKDRGVKIAGWQEIASCTEPSVAAKLKDVMFVNYVWNTAGGNSGLPFTIAACGYPTVMSNVEFTYADQAYSSNKQEIAHDWACFIDDTTSIGLPVRKEENIAGVQAQLFTETIRSFDDVCYDSFPKILGVFERGWNADSTLSGCQFYSIIACNEMPWWDSCGIAYHIPQPGMIVRDGKILTNSVIPEARIEVSADGKHATAVYGSRRSCATTL